jgi:hypothetical protein
MDHFVKCEVRDIANFDLHAGEGSKLRGVGVWGDWGEWEIISEGWTSLGDI